MRFSFLWLAISFLMMGCVSTQPKESVTDIQMEWIPAGTFMMGSPRDEPGRYDNETQHEVTLTQGFYMGTYPITQAQYMEVMVENPSAFCAIGFRSASVAGIDTDNFPVEGVSWYDAIIFCNRLSILTELTPSYRINGETDPDEWGVPPVYPDTDAAWEAVELVADSDGYRLPTEAQWEYACRAGTAASFNSGMDAVQTHYDEYYVYANAQAARNRNRTTEVGRYAPNDWGLYDMHGNVWEWCWDRADKNPPRDYSAAIQTDPLGTDSGAYRIFRGGVWNLADRGVRSAFRGNFPPASKGFIIGFRVVRPGQMKNEE